ncbi:DUF2911 domain-containing protein [Polaribacter sp. Q13]|uniref:DUF2911 domain-containing protein n=1 Tax=Polaribacter sp. Q13 TaxID=2806551 RepID=UPI00193B496A|nr:DUF2911 domain-containing protein [Polaribacter sp. Q13]QVY65666.1 DUF2911 domain-containing protein [Polaribacter sp. Q13]
MNKIILSLFVAIFTFTVNAQIKTPAPSPSQKIEQKVGLTDVTLEYSRPGIKGRTIFGDLVPFNEVWRTGANENTKITFSTDVTVNGKDLKKGTYALYTKPGKDSWNVYFYADTTNWGNPAKWDDAKVAAQAKATPQTMPMKIETFTMTFDNITNSSAVLGILWENTYVGLKFETPTESLVSKQITAVMNGPSANDYYASASYYLEADKDIKKAQTWIDKAIEMTADAPKFYFLRKQALIHAKAGDKKGAIKAAKESLKYSEKAGNAGYVKMNKASLIEWGAM